MSGTFRSGIHGLLAGWVASLGLLAGLGGTLHAQPLSLTVGTGTNELTLQNAIIQANAYASGPVTISIDAADFAGNTIHQNFQLVIGLASANTQGLTILGNGATIDMGGSDRAFFIASGAVTIANLTIANGTARGGNGADGGGGGAGLGGAIFVANSSSVANGAANDNLTLPTAVTLTNVAFTSNQAIGGAGAGYAVSGQGGGGGMGGSGGNGFYYDPGMFDYDQHGGGGGGGFGNQATGGSALAPGNFVGPGTGAFDGWFPNDPASGGNGGPNSDNGGAAGGGAAASNPASFDSDPGVSSGGGGGVNGVGGDPNYGQQPNGGFGGGGGGGGAQTSDTWLGDPVLAGNGGFGGGGGGGQAPGSDTLLDGAASGGFGGGGGSSSEDVSDGAAGFAGGKGVSDSGIGGGGAGLGGAVFVMHGASLTITQDDSGGTAGFTGSAVFGGTTPSGGNNGSAYGYDLFLGSDVTFNVADTLNVNALGGAGNLLDPSVSANASDPNASGGLIKTGSGTLVLSGTSYYSGATVIQQGVLALSQNAAEIGTPSIVVGVTSNAELFLATNSLVSSGTSGSVITLGQSAGVQGALTIGSGSNGAGIGYATVTSGSGSGVIQFNEEGAFQSASDVYPFYLTITGSIGIIQNAPGITLLSPEAGANTYTGGTIVNAGTLKLASTDALPTAGLVQINGGALDLNGKTVTSGTLTLAAGSLINSGSAATLDPTAIVASSGTLGAAIIGTGSLEKLGAGTVTVLAENASTGSVLIEEGTLVLGVSDALSNAQTLVLASGAVLSLGADDALNSDALVDWNGTVSVSAASVSQTLGDTIISAPGSRLDTAGNTLSLTFNTLSLAAGLDVWNWNSGLDEMFVLDGIPVGTASQIRFFGDDGGMLLGYGELDGTQIRIVPEPSTYAMALAGIAYGGFSMWRRRKRVGGSLGGG